MTIRRIHLTLLLGLLILFTSSAAIAESYVLATGNYGTGKNAIELSKHYDDRFCKMATIIEAQRNVSLKCASYNNQERFIEAIAKNKIDLAYVNPFLAYKLKKANKNIQSLVTTAETNNTGKRPSVFYGGALVVNESSPIHSIFQLQQEKIGFSHSHSSSGYIVPQLLFGSVLRSQNNQMVQLAQNTALAEALVSGKVTAAFLWLGMLNKPILKDKVRVLATYDGIPGHQIVINTQRVSKEAQAKILAGFLTIHKSVPHYSGFAAPTKEEEQASQSIYGSYCLQYPQECVLGAE